MALPDKNSLVSLDYVHFGQPFVQVETKQLNTQNLDIAYLAQPFVGADSLVQIIESNVYVKVNGSWKKALDIYVNINGQWKKVEDGIFYVKDDLWRN